jgi:hypothetical protein
VHLNRINFQPDLYAIPWFLTLFTHILPLDKIYPIWDLVLVGRDGLPQFFALAMMKQLRTSAAAARFQPVHHAVLEPARDRHRRVPRGRDGDAAHHARLGGGVKV